MGLRDHFHEPVILRCAWTGIHAIWAAKLTEYLNGTILGDRYNAEADCRLAGGIEIDTVTWDRHPANADSSNGAATSTAVLTAPVTQTWVAPMPDVTFETTVADQIGVRIVDRKHGRELVGAIELVSPANKDRDQKRDSFIGKCAGLLRLGIGVLIVDVVTELRANLHQFLMEGLGEVAGDFGRDAMLYTTSYRPRRISDEPTKDVIEVWQHHLELGKGLPMMPLKLRNGPTIPIDLNLTYEQACEVCRV